MSLLYFGLRDHFTLNGLLYNCTGYSGEYWNEYGRSRSNVPLGVLYLGTGLIYQSLYLPCLYVISRSTQLRLSCYRIMLFLGLVDVTCLSACATVPGVLSIVGAHYCRYPNLFYIIGSMGMGLWGAACLASVVLALNRAIDLCNPALASALFDGKRLAFWFIPPCANMFFYAMIEKPLIYSPPAGVFNFDPLIPYDSASTKALYENHAHMIHNIAISVTLSALYLLLCVLLFIRTHSDGPTRVTSLQKMVVIQSSVICITNVLAAGIYVISQHAQQYFPIPYFVTVIGTMAWHADHGSVAVIYVTMNQTIRSSLLNVLGYHSKSSTTSSSRAFQSRNRVFRKSTIL